MLHVGSALWTTYDQFWGSILTYIVAVMMAPIAPRGRYITYFIMWVEGDDFSLLLIACHSAQSIRLVLDVCAQLPLHLRSFPS
jgi:hypothetical protein